MPRVEWSAKCIPTCCVARDGKRTHYSFNQVEGLVLDCLGNGTRVWKVRYETPQGGRRIARKMSIGRFEPEARRGHGSGDRPDVLTPGMARDRARSVLSAVRAGRDPWLEQRAEEVPTPSVPTFEIVFRQWLTDTPRKARTIETHEGVYGRHIEPRLGAKQLNGIDKSLVRTTINEIKLATTDPAKGHRGLQATKALSLIHSVLDWAVKNDIVEWNVAQGIDVPVPKKNPSGKQHRPLTEDELHRVWNEAPNHMSAQSVHILRLALLLGKRVSEIVGAEKKEVLLERARWFIPAHREGNKSAEIALVPLPSVAVGILSEAMAESARSPYVFQARGPIFKQMSRHTPSHDFTHFRRALGIEDQVRFHDARGLVIDQMSLLRIPTEYRSHVMHHTGDMRRTLADAAYSTYDYEAEKRQALELWAARLAEIVEGRQANGLRWSAM